MVPYRLSGDGCQLIYHITYTHIQGIFVLYIFYVITYVHIHTHVHCTFDASIHAFHTSVSRVPLVAYIAAVLNNYAAIVHGGASYSTYV